MKPAAVLAWRAVALVLFAAVMTVLWFGLDWFVNAIPVELAMAIGFGGGGICAGVLIGEAAERRRALRSGSELRR